jgi:predicted O-methyltransferase YrrM
MYVWQWVITAPSQFGNLRTLREKIDFRGPLPRMRGWSIAPDFALILYDHVRQHCPTHIVELGAGTSTIIDGYAVQHNGTGHVTGIDHKKQFSKLTRGSLKRHKLKGVAEILTAPLTNITLDGETWHYYDPDKLATLDPIDMLVVDGPSQQGAPQDMVRYPALPLLFDKLNPGALILVDDAIRSHEQAIIARWQAEFPVERVATFDTQKGTALLQKA